MHEAREALHARAADGTPPRVQHNRGAGLACAAMQMALANAWERMQAAAGSNRSAPSALMTRPAWPHPLWQAVIVCLLYLMSMAQRTVALHLPPAASPRAAHVRTHRQPSAVRQPGRERQAPTMMIMVVKSTARDNKAAAALKPTAPKQPGGNTHGCGGRAGGRAGMALLFRMWFEVHAGIE